MPISIQPYRPKDREKLSQLVAEFHDVLHAIEPEEVPPGQEVKEAYTAFLLESVTEKNGGIAFAVEGNETAGFVAWWRTKNPDETKEYVYVSDVFVVSSYQRRGIGTQLLQYVENWTREHGITSMRINSFINNPGATKLYKSLGFADFIRTMKKDLG